MSAPSPSLGLPGPSADTAPALSSRRIGLTCRGEYVVAAAVMVGLFLLLWLAEAIGYALTGVNG